MEGEKGRKKHFHLNDYVVLTANFNVVVGGVLL